LEDFYEMLAYHYSRSENAEKAYHYLKLSGNKATKNYSNWEAFRYCIEAIDVLTKMPETENNKREQIEVRLLIAGPMYHLGFPEDSLEILQTGETISKDLGDENGLALFLSLIGQYYAFKGGDLLQAIQYSEDSFEEAEKINDIELMAPVGADLSLLYFWVGDLAKVIAVASKVIPLLEKTQKQAEFFGRPYNSYSFILAQQSTCTWAMGNLEKGRALFEKGHDFALKIKDLLSLAMLELHRGWDFNFKGDATTAIEHFQNSIGYCDEGQIINILIPIWIGLGWAYWLLGDLETAHKHMEKGLKTQSDAGVDYDSGFFYSCSAVVELESGNLNKAQQLANEALNIAQKNHQHGEGLVWIVLGRILGRTDHPQNDKAEEAFLKGIKIFEELKLKLHYAPGYYYLGELYAGTGQKDKALETLKWAEDIFREMEMDFWLAKTQDLLATL